MMLHAVPDISANLKSHGAELHIIGKNQATSHLPEYRHWHGKPFDGEMDIDERTRGLGGIPASCGEENLLRLAQDRYLGRDICVHEFAHTIHLYGLDDKLRRMIDSQYRRSIKKGLWTGCYAGTSVDEFFAELCMWYFGTRGDFGKIKPTPGVGAEWLKRYDRQAFKLLDDLFNCRFSVKKVNLKKLRQRSIDLESQTKSKNADVRTQVVFRNNTESKLKLFWLDYEGKRKFYAEIQPMDYLLQHTFATHPWLITDDANDPKAIFIAHPYPGIAWIT